MLLLHWRTRTSEKLQNRKEEGSPEVVKDLRDAPFLRDRDAACFFAGRFFL